MRLASKLLIPNIATETIGIIGKRGSGKTHTGMILVEELLDAKVQTIIIDPTGGSWGLRAGSDGKKEGGYPIPIFGGLHADMPLEERGGTVLAEYVVENRLSCVLDLSDFSKSAMRRFVRDFAEKLYLLKNKQREPLHIVIDECDLFVPQRVDSADMLPLVGAINDFVLRGRTRGIGVTLISQRPARIAKDVLTQIEILIAFRLTGPQDINAFGDWIEHNGTKEEQKQVLGTLSSLERGTGWFWAPGLMDGMLKCVSFRERKTFDSSRTPDGKRVKPPKTLADVDLGALSAQMAATVEQAKANDPKALKAEVMRLKKELEAAGKFKKLQPEPSPARIPKRVEVPLLTKRQEKKLEKQVDALVEALGSSRKATEDAKEKTLRAEGMAQSALDELKRLRQQMQHLAVGKIVVPSIVVAPKEKPTSKPKPKAQVNGDASKIEGDIKVPRSFVAAVAQFGESGATRKQLTAVTGAKTSTRNAYLQRGYKAGLFEEVGDRHRITLEGVEWLGDDYEELPTGHALFEHWIKKLPGGQRECLQAASEAYPESISRDAIGEQHPDWAMSTRNAYIARVVARQLLEEVSRTHVRMSDMLAEDV
jgi:hypothetical protein